MTVIVPTDWTSMMTAIGTVAVAIVAVAVALFAEWRAGIRVTDERAHAAKVLTDQQKLHDQEIADERKLADERLTRQLEHSTAQIAEERKAADERLKAQLEHSDAQLREERQRAQDAEQLGEAYAVVVVLGERAPGDELDLEYMLEQRVAGAVYEDVGDPDVRTLVLMITNKGKYTITRVEAQFSPDGQSLLPHDISTRVTDLDKLPDVLRAGQPGMTESAYGDVLTPWDAGMRFVVKGIHKKHISGPYAVVRWTDRWGQRWQHKKGEVLKVSEGEEWRA